MIEVYSKSACTFCGAAKNLLKLRGKEFTEYQLGVDFTREELIEKFPTARTYPLIVIDGEYIGGYDQLKARLG